MSIGHTHHKDEVADFHAEVMPIEGDRVSFYLLKETGEGKPEDHAIANREIGALISVKEEESNRVNCAFTGVGNGQEASAFSMEIPDAVAAGQTFTVMIPEVEFEGIRQSFTFTVSRQDRGDTETAEEDSRNR